MKKKTAIFLAAILVISISVAVLAVNVVDSPTPKVDNPISVWAMDAVVSAGKNNILEKEKNYIFGNPITREEFCELIYNLIYSQDIVIAYDFAVQGIEDTDNPKVLELYAREIIKGKSENLFVPNDLLTREEAATIMDRTVAKVFNFAYTQIYFEFSDEKDISAWAMSGIQNICNMGFMKGTGNGLFSPKGILTVEEAITALMRVFDAYKANEEIKNVASNTDVSHLTFADKMNLNMPKDKNYLFSPLSIKMALSMAANGASGKTQKEILDAVGIYDLALYNQSVEKLIETYSHAELLQCNVANSMWINTDRTDQRFSNGYKSQVKNIFGATSDTVTDKTALPKINGWVEDKTRGKIPTIITEDNADFWAMLVNAVYFKGRWQNEFSKAATKKDVFTDRNGKETDIDFMHKTAFLDFANKNDVTIVALPYLTREDKLGASGEHLETNILEGVNVSMYLLMSDQKFNPESVLKEVETERKYIKLSVPKFKITYSAEISEMLKKIGIKEAFQKTAEFDNMFHKGNMWLTDVMHKTYIQVDEEGTEAAAVTALAKAGGGLPPEPIEIHFKKPFTFVIRDNINDEILFMGEYAFAE